MKRYLPALALLLAGAPARPAEPTGTTAATLMSAAHEVGALQAGEREARRVMLVDQAESVTFVLASPRHYDAEVVLPDGSVLSAGTADGERRRWRELWLDDARSLVVPGLALGANVLATVEHPDPGPYEIRLRPREEVRDPVAFAFTMLPLSEVRVGLALPESKALAGRPVVVSALAYDGEQPLDAREVRALVARQPDDPREPRGEPLRIELSDRGGAPDAQAGDGVYTGTFTPGEEGRYWVAVHVSGTSASGHDFQRDVGGAVTITKDDRLLTGAYDSAGLDTNDNGRLDRLRVTIRADIPSAGPYDAVVQLRGQDGQTITAHALRTLEAGDRELAVDFTGGQVRSLRSDGPFEIASVQIDELTASDRVLRDRAYQAGRTPAWRLDEFEDDPRP